LLDLGEIKEFFSDMIINILRFRQYMHHKFSSFNGDLRRHLGMLTQLLDELLVLVELLQGFGVHGGNAVRLSLVTMLLVTKNANAHLGARDVLQPKFRDKYIISKLGDGISKGEHSILSNVCITHHR
jgi:hypothetical protein